MVRYLYVLDVVQSVLKFTSASSHQKAGILEKQQPESSIFFFMFERFFAGLAGWPLQKTAEIPKSVEFPLN
jgi:hypothetical protein